MCSCNWSAIVGSGYRSREGQKGERATARRLRTHTVIVALMAHTARAHALADPAGAVRRLSLSPPPGMVGVGGDSQAFSPATISWPATLRRDQMPGDRVAPDIPMRLVEFSPPGLHVRDQLFRHRCSGLVPCERNFDTTANLAVPARRVAMLSRELCPFDEGVDACGAMLETCGSASGRAYLPGDRVGLSSRPALERRSGRYAHAHGSADRIDWAGGGGGCAVGVAVG